MVSKFFDFHPYLLKWSNLANVFLEWVETTNQINLAGLLKTLWNSSNHWNMVTKSRIHLIASFNLGFIPYLKMGPGIIEEFILNWLCPFSVCNEQDHIPWQCQPVQIRRKSSFLFCLNQSPKFQSNSTRVWAWGKWNKMMCPLQLRKRWKLDNYFSMWNAKMPGHILLFENFRSLETYILQFTGGTWRTHTHTFWSNGRNLPIPSVFQGHLMFPIHVCENEIPVPHGTQTTDSRCPGNGKKWKCKSTFQIMEEWTMNYFFLFESCRSLKLISGK